MWNKIYSAVLAAAILAMSILLYLPYSWLQSVTAPKDVVVQYDFYSNISWIFLLISSLILLIVGNVVLWKTRRSWAMWTTLLYFAVFMVAYTFWLEQIFFQFQRQNNITTEVISFSPIFGIVLVVLAAIIVFFDQYLVKRLLDKTYPPLQTAESLPVEVPTDEKNI